MDSEASDHYFLSWFMGDTHNPTNNGSPVGTGSNNIIRSVAADWFDISALTHNALVLVPRAYTCKKSTKVQLPLVSVRKLSTHRLTILFNEDTVTVNNKHGDTIIIDEHNVIRNLYMIRIIMTITDVFPRVKKLPQQQASNAYKIQTAHALVSYLHATAGFLSEETFLCGIEKNFYSPWPSISAQRVRRHLKQLEFTTLGHLKIICRSICSTIAPHKESKAGSKIQDFGCIIMDDKELWDLIAMDLPGRYWITSARGHKYNFVVLYYNYDYINAIPMT